ncbi:MAG TPA: hypothetical protein VJM31_01550 [Vicinamibacterales bacterium]|nr:hypothetical protein [Vicinamibacterales bacterium]
MRTQAFEQLVKRVKGEFIEMPGLRLTLEQGSRLWGLKHDECDALLHSLVHRKFLTVTAAGRYGRATDGVASNVSLRAAKASLKSGAAIARSADTTAGRRVGGRSSRD